MSPIDTLKLALRFAFREIRGGLTGFYVFLACIALGTAAIGGVNAVSQAITQGIETEGATNLKHNKHITSVAWNGHKN